MNIKPLELTGVRAKLVPMNINHLSGLYEASKNPDIWTYLPLNVHNLEDMTHLINDALKLMETGTEIPFVVVDQEVNQIVGTTRFLNISIPNRHLEIGWTWYNPSVWRTRINTECKYLLLTHCFESLKTVRVQFSADIRNTRSNNAIKRLGAVHEGVLRRNRILSDGFIRDASVYSIIEEEWPFVKTTLESYLEIQ